MINMAGKFITIASVIALGFKQTFALSPCDACGVANVNVAHTGTPTGEMKEVNGGNQYTMM
jgi:hypothetical protein